MALTGEEAQDTLKPEISISQSCLYYGILSKNEVNNLDYAVSEPSSYVTKAVSYNIKEVTKKEEAFDIVLGAQIASVKTRKIKCYNVRPTRQ